MASGGAPNEHDGARPKINTDDNRQHKNDERPKRKRSKNVRLADYYVELPASINPSSPLGGQLRLLEQTIDANLSRVERARDLADDLMKRGDINSTVLKNCYTRIEGSGKSSIDAAEKMLEHLDIEDRLKLRDFAYDIRDYVERGMDDIAISLSAGQAIQTSEQITSPDQGRKISPIRRAENIVLHPRQSTPIRSPVRGADTDYIPQPDDTEDNDSLEWDYRQQNFGRNDGPPAADAGDQQPVPNPRLNRTIYFDDDDMSIDTPDDINMQPQQPNADVTATLVKTLEKLAANSEIPATPAMIFGGDSADYPAFVKDFEDRVGKKPFSDSVKLSQLIQCTKSKAHDAVVVYRGQNRGYIRARQTLMARFGQPLQIVDALMNRLEGQGRIRQNDSQALLYFADKLEAYYETFMEFQLMTEANTQATLKRVFTKLPSRTQYKWIDKVNDLEIKGQTPTFKNLVDFVRAQARRSTHPVYQVEERTNEHIRRPMPSYAPMRRNYNYRPNMNQVTTLATSAGTGENEASEQSRIPPRSNISRPHAARFGPPDITCDFCKRRHHGILSCPIFAQKTSLERKGFVRENRLCWSCFGRHSHINCRRRDTICGVNGCAGKHHPLIHINDSQRVTDQRQVANHRPADSQRQTQRYGPRYSNPNDRGRTQTRQQNGNVQQQRPQQRQQTTTITVENESDNDDEAENEQVVGALNTQPPMRSILLRVVPVRLHVAGSDKMLTTFALLDTGSTNSMVTQHVADKLELRGEKAEIALNTVVQKGDKISVEVVQLELSPMQPEGDIIQLRNAQVVPNMHLSSSLIQDNVDVTKWPHLKNLLTTDTHEVDIRQIGVLIGEDCPPAHCTFDEIRGNNPYEEPYAVLTPFGWSLAGPTGPTGGQQKTTVATEARSTQDDALEQAVSRMWNEEKLGFGNDELKISEADKRALKILESETYKDADGHYVVPLLWKSDVTVLKNNYFAALKYLQSLKRKFEKKPEFARKYRDMLNGYIQKGYARKLTHEEATHTTPRTFYLPHQGVENPNKPGKVRVVFNAAHCYHGFSLNTALYHGPDLVNNMLGVLLRFRLGPFALVGDIAEMFHQVKSSEADADSLRFLWYENKDDTDPQIYRMERHIFGATDSPAACSFALKRTVEDNKETYDTETVQAVHRNMYVDDLAKACYKEEEMIRLGNQLISLMDRGGFKLTKLVSNSQATLNALPQDRIAPDCQEKSLDNLPSQRTLGVVWDLRNDELRIKVNVCEKPMTKRGCLSFICSIPDVMGLLAPVTLVGRRVMQEVVRRKLGWDEAIPEDLAKSLNKWKMSLPALENLSIRRCYKGLQSIDRITSIQIHHFCDGSEYAYGTCSYLRIETDDGPVQVSLIMGKSRTAPIQFLSIPRLEMQAATVCARIAAFLRRELDLNWKEVTVYFWTDSMIALQYIKTTTKRLKTYNATRKQDILDASTADQWYHCPTKQNPADIASRGVLGNKLERTMWFSGPEFLKKPKTEWPGIGLDIPELSEDDPEIKKETIIASVTTDKIKATVADMLGRCSNWLKLQKQVVWITKFSAYMKHKMKPSKYKMPTTTITVSDLNTAESDIVRIVQQEYFEDEISRLSKGELVSTKSCIRKLNPVMIDGIIRVGGRLAEAPLCFESKHPAILPKHHKIIPSIVWSYHRAVGHEGPEHTLAELRSKFWILGGKSTIKSVISLCIPCKRKNAKRVEQIMSSLPKERVTGYEPPFTVTGMDVFGPLYVKRARSTLKKYVLLFTCFSTRAVHLEVLENMNTDSFINALVRFASRRVKSKKIFCDNGSNFVGGFNELRKEIDEAKLLNYTVQNGIDFQFQTPTASHTSGVWERLIKSCKEILKNILGGALVSEETLTTSLAQVEHIMNGRPITACSEDTNDLGCLTPNHLLLQRASEGAPWCVPDEGDIYRRSWRQAQLLSQHYWDRWTSVYLPQLQKLTKWTATGRDLRVGDLVLLCDDTLKQRGRWPIARIEEVFPGDDGHVRSVSVKTTTGTYKRPAQKLTLLEGVID